MNIWRLQTKTSGCGKDTQICDYCVKNSVIAMGWSLIYSEHEQERNNIKTWEDYIELNNTICREKG